MTVPSRSRPVAVDDLRDNVKSATMKRLVEVFKNPNGEDQAKFHALAQITEQAVPSVWSADPTRALIVVMREAVRRLPDERATDCSITWREFGELVCGFRQNLPELADGNPYGYDDLLKLAKAEAAYRKSPRTFHRRITTELWNKLASKLDQIEVEARAGNRLDAVRERLPLNSSSIQEPSSGLVTPIPSKDEASRIPSPEPRTKGDLKLSAGIANVTRGDTTYAKSVTAWVDDVIKIQMTYESTAATKALRDFVPHFRLPSELSREHHVVVAGTAARGEHVAEVPITIKSTVPTTLVYVPGSAKWRRNTMIGNSEPTHETAHIEDSVIGPAPLAVDNVLPGPEHRATISILARVASNAISVRLVGTSDLTKAWREDIAVRRGNVAHLRLTIRNCGNRLLRSLIVYCNLSDVTSLVSGSACLTKADGAAQPLPDDLIRNSDPTGSVRHEQVEDGLSIGELPVGKTLNVEYEVRINKKAPVGSIATVVGVVQPLGMNEFYNTVKIAVQR